MGNIPPHVYVQVHHWYNLFVNLSWTGHQIHFLECLKKKKKKLKKKNNQGDKAHLTVWNWVIVLFSGL